MIHFPRSAMAQQLAQALQGKDLFGDAHNGLFLAAPRRTGKSTFLQADLKPELEKRGVVVVYVDLWAAPQRDPGELIAEAIGRSLKKHLGPIAKAAKASGLDSITIAGALKMDTSKIGRADGSTLTDALRTLHELAASPVALIVDEAQHSLTSESGEHAMTALKSARDQLNSPGHVNLMLVMSGSDRDKLLRLVNANASPFYGSQIQRMPELGADFIAHVVQRIQQSRPELGPVDQGLLTQAFDGFGRQPQFFMAALGQVLSPLSGVEGRFESAMLEAAAQRQRENQTQMVSDYLGLRPLEQLVLWRMLAQGPRFRPYDADSLRFYQEQLKEKTSPQKVQTALESLRTRQPSLIWKSARSEYAVDDAAMHRWYAERVAAGTWPPMSDLALGQDE